MSATATFSQLSTSAATSTSTATPSCITTVPGLNDHVPIEDCRSIWFYDPSVTAAIIVSAAFGISTLIHIIQARVYRMTFCWVIIMGTIWETAGFILRILSAKNQITFGIYVPEELLILLAPIWINAFDYMLLGRMVYYFLPDQKIFGVHATKFAKYFVIVDVSSFIIQAIGGAILSQGSKVSTDTLYLSLHIYMGGVSLQQAFILGFLSLAIQFHRRMLELEKQGVLQVKGKLKWRRLLYTLYISLTLITIRVVFRLVQYAFGFFSTIPLHEVFFYTLEALPMILALYAMNITHPGGTLVGPDPYYPTREQKRAEREAKRERSYYL